MAPPDPARRPRWGRAIATVLAIVAVAASAWVLVSIRDRVPDPFDDSWVVLDTDASTLRVMFSGVGPERIVRYTDSSSTRCGGIPAQAEGIGRIEEPGHLVFDPSGLFRCDDGSIAPSGTFQWVHDLATDTLVSKGKGLLWERDS